MLGAEYSAPEVARQRRVDGGCGVQPCLARQRGRPHSAVGAFSPAGWQHAASHRRTIPTRPGLAK
jgi:hypothetical protein